MSTRVIEMPCITCPMSCHLTAELNENGEVLSVSGNTCKRGEAYAKAELTNPVRTVTSTVKIENGTENRLPVITKGQIPKDKMFDVMKEIHQTKVCAPIKENDIIIKNICNLDIDLVASRSVEVRA